MVSESDIAEMISRTIRDYIYEMPPLGATIGVPWSTVKIVAHVELLKNSLVAPRLQRFVLRETYEHITSTRTEYADYWIVAESGDNLVWYDQRTNEYGLGERRFEDTQFVSLGVRGDLVGTFCAI